MRAPARTVRWGPRVPEGDGLAAMPSSEQFAPTLSALGLEKPHGPGWLLVVAGVGLEPTGGLSGSDQGLRAPLPHRAFLRRIDPAVSPAGDPLCGFARRGSTAGGLGTDRASLPEDALERAMLELVLEDEHLYAVDFSSGSLQP